MFHSLKLISSRFSRKLEIVGLWACLLAVSGQSSAQVAVAAATYVRTEGGEMICVPAGAFIMGNERLFNAGPAHQVYLDSFYIDQCEVTVAQYRAFVRAAGRNMPPKPSWGWKDDHPIIKVNWSEAGAYCAWAGKRLPTEAEWEKAARGTDGQAYPWAGDFPEDRANLMGAQDGYATTAPVGRFPKGRSAYGVVDMAGNVWEWCADWYEAEYYAHSPAHNPKGPARGQTHVFRGGAWNNTLYVLQTANRGHAPPDFRDNSIGFRCAKSARPGGRPEGSASRDGPQN